MQRYVECPLFGSNRCCGTAHDKSVKRIDNLTVDLQFQDGSIVSVHPWMMANKQEFSEQWYAQRLQHPEYEAIHVSKLTQGSRMKYSRHHHWGTLSTYKYRHCPYLVQKNKK